jgi:hypothetical protein
MEDKHKVTLYMPSDLHRQLKVKAAVDAEPMSEIAERAISFYLSHPEMVNEAGDPTLGASHRVYSCPACATAMVMKSQELVLLGEQPSILDDHGVMVPDKSSDLVAAVV